VLALQLPFLLDGDVSPHRLEPDGDPAKRIEWNLLMGKHTDRQGYTWLELGRREPDGQAKFLTIGCGLSAAEGRGLVGRWYFVTEMRVGADLSLIAPEGYALSRERLVEMIAGRGEVFTTATRYRSAVNGALFKLSEHQYSALVTLLIQLRQPQLSRQLDEKRLSAALGDALRPLPSGVVSDVAEAFRSLESDRLTVEAFTAARRGTDAFLGEYRRYASIAARRSAGRVRAAHAEYERTMRKLRAAEAALETATRDEEEIRATLGRLEIDEHATASEVATLQASPQMRTANELRAAREMADERAQRVEQMSIEVTRVRETRSGLEIQRVRAGERASVSHQLLDAALKQAAVGAVAVGVEPDHETAVALFVTAGDARVIANGPRGLYEVVARRQAASRFVRGLNQALLEAQRRHHDARDAHSARSAQLDDAVDTNRQAAQRHATEMASLANAYDMWVASLQELKLPDVEAIRDAIVDWCQTAEGTSPLTSSVVAAATDSLGRLADLRSDAHQREKAVRDRLADLNEQAGKLARGDHLPPPVPHTRGEAVRDTRLGAPLWRLCDYRSDVPEGARAGLEAALEASGLLDAWVMPDGQLLAAGDDDTILVAAGGDNASPDRHAGLVLVSAIDTADPRAAAVHVETIERLLRQIGLGSSSSDVSIAEDGSWRVGPLQGQWHKPAAVHIGESAREAARRAALARVRNEIAVAEAALTGIVIELSTVLERERATRAERDAAPLDGAVRDAMAHVAASQAQVDGLRRDVSAAEGRVIELYESVTQRLDERGRAAADLGITPWVDDLQRLDDAVADYRSCIGDLLHAMERHRDLAEAATAASDRLRAAVDEEFRVSQQLADAYRLAAEAVAARDTMQATVGAAVEEVLDRLARATRTMDTVRADLKRARESHAGAQVRVGQARVDIEGTTEVLRRDETARQVAMAGLEGFVATGLIDLVAVMTGETTPGEWPGDASGGGRSKDRGCLGVSGQR
jgi:uncharacterized protein (TIGR02680 family)